MPSASVEKNHKQAENALFHGLFGLLCWVSPTPTARRCGGTARDTKRPKGTISYTAGCTALDASILLGCLATLGRNRRYSRLLSADWKWIVAVTGWSEAAGVVPKGFRSIDGQPATVAVLEKYYTNVTSRAVCGWQESHGSATMGPVRIVERDDDKPMSQVILS